MAGRYSGLVVTLDTDITAEEAQPLMAAIARLRGVLDVRQVTSRPGLELVLRSRIRGLLRERLPAALPDDAAMARVTRYEAHLSKEFAGVLDQLRRARAIGGLTWDNDVDDGDA